MFGLHSVEGLGFVGDLGTQELASYYFFVVEVGCYGTWMFVSWLILILVEGVDV